MGGWGEEGGSREEGGREEEMVSSYKCSSGCIYVARALGDQKVALPDDIYVFRWGLHLHD